MNRVRILGTLFALLSAAFAVSLVLTYGSFPDRVSGHFGGRGSDWESRSQYFTATAREFLIPALIVTISYALRFVPASSINLPNRSWLQPEHRSVANRQFLVIGFSFASVCLICSLGKHFLTLYAHTLSPVQFPRLGIFGFFSFSFCSGIGILLWLMTFFDREP